MEPPAIKKKKKKQEDGKESEKGLSAETGTTSAPAAKSAERADLFTDIEVQDLISKASKKKQRKEVKKDQNEVAEINNFESPGTGSKCSQTSTADKADALCKAANNDSESYVSFKSFLGIKDQPEDKVSCPLGVTKVEAPSEEVKAAGGGSKKLLDSTVASSSHCRSRPTREKEQKGSTLKELEDSIQSLIKK